MRKEFLLLFIFTVLSFSCDRRSPHSSLQIVGGDKPDLQSPIRSSTVALVKREGSGFVSYCTGSLIAPRLVLTAAHCVEDIRGPIQIAFAQSDRDPDAIIGKSEAFKTFKAGGSRFFPNFDIAWIRLKDPAPAAWKPIEILRDPRQLKELEGKANSVLLGGYGRTSTYCRQEEEGCAGDLYEVYSHLASFISQPHFVSLLVIGPKPGHGTCNGDSGGPAMAMIAGRWYLVGALNGKSPLLNSAAVLDKSACESGEAIFNFPGHYADWIESTSGQKLSFDEEANPPGFQTELMSPLILGQQPSLEDFLRFDNHHEVLWETVETLMNAFKDPNKRVDGSFEEILSNPAMAAAEMRAWQDFAHNGLTYSFPSLAQKDNQLVDIRPIGELVSLKKLELHNNRIIGTKALGGLHQLEELALSNNYDFAAKTTVAWDLRFLGELSQLKKLNLSGNSRNLPLSSIPWDRLTNLTTLMLSDNPDTLNLEQIPWEKLPNLTELVINGSGLQDVTALSRASSLKKLMLRHNAIDSIKALGKLTQLEELDISQNRILDFGPVARLSHLRSLKALSNPQIAPVCPVGSVCLYSPAELPDFQSYCLFAQSLSEEDRLQWTGGRTVLRMVEAAGLLLAQENICPKADAILRAMTSLNLSGRATPLKIDDLRPLAPLTQLQNVEIDHNQLRDLWPLAKLKNLRSANLSNNWIEDVIPLTLLPQINILKLDDNRIQSLEALQSIPGLQLSASRNPATVSNPEDRPEDSP